MDKNMSSELEIGKTCRICLRRQNLRPLFETFENNQTFADILNECTRYQVARYDELPQHICGNCEIAALNAFKFKRKCEQSYCQLVKSLQLSTDYKEIKLDLNKKAEKYTQTEYSAYAACDHCEEKYFSCNAQKTNGTENPDSFNHINPKTFIAGFNSDTTYQSSNLCPICKRQFTLREHLIRHLTLIHKIVKFNSLDSVDDTDEDTFKNLNTQDVSNLYDSENNTNDVENLDDYTLEPINHTNSDDVSDKTLDMFQNSDESRQHREKNVVNHVIIGEYNENSKNIRERGKANHQLDETSDNESSSYPSLSRELSPNQNKETEHPCTLCKKDFKKAVLLCKHMKTRHSAAKQICCTQCDKKFPQLSQYHRHKETKHKEKIHKCSVCDKTFSTKIYLQRHIVIHERKRYACKECTQMFVTKVELNAHLKAEGHDKPLLCPECGLRCKTSNILMVHMRRHKGEKPFKCKFCSKGFPRMDDLRIHEKYHTGEKSHFCETCGKGFQRKYNLTIHLRVHTGEKPYKCPHCPQAFAQGNDLKAHIRRHTGERFRCEHCGAAFLQGYQIRQHKLNEHGIREDPPTQRVAKFTSTEAQEIQIKQNLQNELKHSVDETTLNENNLNIEMDSLPLDISGITNSALDGVEVSLEVSNFSNIEF